MHLFLVASNLPSPGHSVRAATVLVREALVAVQALGHSVTFQPLLAELAGEGTDGAVALAWAKAQGIEVLEPLVRPDPPFVRRLGLAHDALSSSPSRFFPGYALRDEVARRVAESGAEAVFHLWSAEALAACADVDVPVFAYYGNPDHKSFAARLAHPHLFGIPTRTLRNRTLLALLRGANGGRRRAGVRLMQKARWAANVCAVDADWYAQQGHPDSFYLQNMWPRPADEVEGGQREAGKIVGNLGGLYATGNTFGLWFLTREIMPALERRLGAGFGVHIYGAGTPTPAVAEGLQRPSIHVRGFVDDIDAELRSARVFILANNNNPDFVVGHTRILHAWASGLCVVGHRNTHRAMPEVVHGENALLGETGEEIAELTAQALHDDALRERLAAGGHRTLTESFAPEVVMARALGLITADHSPPDGERVQLVA